MEENKEQQKKWQDFIETTITKSVNKAVSKKLDHYTVPDGYITCKECGTVYPEDCLCPKCIKIKNKGEVKDESKDKKEDGQDKTEQGDTGKTEEGEEGKGKSDPTNGDGKGKEDSDSTAKDNPDRWGW